jgi:glycosyltransferase involved in cell wall biosynthesis
MGKSIPGLRGWDCHVLRYGYLWSTVMGAWLRRSVPLDRFDLVHIMNQHHAMALLGASLPKSLARVVAIDATAVAERRDFGYGFLDRGLIARRERQLFGAVDAVGCMSGWVADSVEKDYGLHPSAVIRARLGVDASWIVAGRRPNRMHSDFPRLLFVGNDWVRKGGDRLIRWFQARWRGRAELHLVGHGCPQFPGAVGIVSHGPVEHGRLVHHLMPAMDLCVLPTREDTLVFALLEAQAAGVPVVSSRLAGIHSDVVLDGVTGLLCDPDDDDAFIHAVESLLVDPARRKDMGEAARRHAMDHWSAEREGNRYLDALVKVVGRRKGGGSANLS